MWRNYITVGVRALLKSKTYAIINIFGLAVGLAACLALFLYVRFERSYDAWLPDAARTYQVQTQWYGDSPSFGQESPYRVAWELKQDFPQIEAAASAFIRSPIVRIGAESSIVEGVWVADPSMLEVLRLPFEAGNPATALAESGSAVVSAREARRLFGTGPALGRTFTVSVAGQDVVFRVTGVLADLPENTHLNIPMMIRLDRSLYADQSFLFELWTSGTGVSYVRLRENTSAEAVNAAIPAFERRRMPPNDVGRDGVQPQEALDFRLTNVRDVHLGEAQMGAQMPGNDPRRIATFSTIALLLLAISCINFVNLTTARSSLRAREVALRKAVGARRYQLIGQFIGESLIVTTVGMLLALALLELATPLARPYFESALDFRYFGTDGLAPAIFGLTALVGIASGAYPALVLSRFSPAEILRGGRAAPGGKGRLRAMLVASQFAVSIALVICTGVVYAQVNYAIGQDPGFRRDGLMALTSIYRAQIDEPTRQTLIERIGALPNVTGVVRTNVVPPLENFSKRNFQRPGRPPQMIGDYYVAPGYFETLGTRLVAGREFSRDQARDEVPEVVYEASTPAESAAQQAFVRRGLNIVVNESAMRAFGWRSPAEALGQTIRADLIATQAGLIPATIVGIVPDIQFRSARDTVEPAIFINKPEDFSRVLVRFEGVAPNVAVARIERVWRELVRDVPLQTRLVDDEIARLYERDILEGRMFAFFAALTTLVGCLGLFGLAAFTTERRTREIGIRKVLGARVRDIVGLLSWQFSKPVILANLIAWPAAWWVMREWLNGFSDRVALSPLWFVAAGALALVIALAVTGTHAFRVARANPIHALRYE